MSSYDSTRASEKGTWYQELGLPILIVCLLVGGARAVDLFLDRNTSQELEAAKVALAQAGDSQVKVVIYSTPWCGVCKKAKAWLGKNGIPYEDHDVESDRAAANTYHALNPRGGVPTIDVDGQVMVGFSEGQLSHLISAAAKKRAGT